MKRKLSNQGIALCVLAGLLLVAIGIGVIRHLPKGKIELEPLSKTRLLVSLNKAGVDDLTRLPGIGPALAARVVAYRDSHGTFLAPESLLNVPGIGKSKLEDLKPYIEVP